MEPGKQFDGFLSGIDWNKYAQTVKQPHQMTPDEFAAHPYAVFHGTSESDEVLNNVSKDSSSGSYKHEYLGDFKRHYGTEQAANEIQANQVINYGDKPGDGPGSDRPRVFTYWHEPKSSQVYPGYRSMPAELIGTQDSVANQITGGGFGIEQSLDQEEKSASKQLQKNKSIYYQNEHEDVGSTSLVITDPNRVKSQADYVRTAIRAGKAHEVHPITMGLYKSGQLSKPYNVTRNNALKMTDLDGYDDHIHEENWEPQLSGLEDKEGGRYPTPERVSDNGPDVIKTAAEYIRRKTK
jgi:hypothetical protein